MALKDRLFDTRQGFINLIEEFFKSFAKIFGYPETNLGMPIHPPRQYFWNERQLFDDLPFHQNVLPVSQEPKNIVEMLFGDWPNPNIIPRLYYENFDDGFYSFYIPNYRNIIFLPNFVSQYLQMEWHYCLDITYLEMCRQVIFAMIVGYYHIVNIRFYMSWLVSINPYTRPWIFITALVDWTEDLFLGLLPTFMGVSTGGAALSALVGMLADTVTHVVFTMPYLPSEGEPMNVLVNGKLMSVLRFRYLPILWYKYPIPNEVREYWYTKRPDILNYFQKAYQNLDIQFLPDHIISDQPINKISQTLGFNYSSIWKFFSIMNFEHDNLNFNHIIYNFHF